MPAYSGLPPCAQPGAGFDALEYRMKIATQIHPALKEMAQQLEGQRVAMLTLREADGLLISRPMTPQEMDADGAIWTLLARGTTTESIQRGPAGHDAVNLAFIDERGAACISIACRATVVDSADRKRALWSLRARPWFPGGAEDPSLTLLRVQPLRAEVWDGPSSSTMRALSFAASVVAGEPLGLGDHAVLDLPMSAAAGAH